MQAVAGRHALDGRDLAAVGLDREHRARLHGAAVEMDGAGAALAGVAADVRAGQVEVLAQGLDEQPSRLDVELPGRPVDRQLDVLAHGWTSSGYVSRGVESARAPPGAHPGPAPTSGTRSTRAAMVAPWRHGIKRSRIRVGGGRFAAGS